MCEEPATEEIEVTPEMIEAGVAAFWAFDLRAEGPEGAVEDIFCAMWKARSV